MSSLNKKAKEVVENYDVSACTDITGFGLLGHCVEMASASDVTFEIQVRDMAYFADAIDYAKMGLVPAGTYKNKGYSWKGRDWLVEEHYVDLLYDPQTSGGLLISVSPDSADDVMEDFEEKGNGYKGVDDWKSIGKSDQEDNTFIRLIENVRMMEGNRNGQKHILPQHS